MKKRIAIFGSTGSIGTSTLNIIRNNPEIFEAVTLVAGNNIERLIEQINEFNPKHVYIKSEENSKILKEKFKDAIFIFIRAWILDFNPEAPYIYPYFFLNLDELGVVGVIKWIGILSVVFIVIGYAIFGLDKILSKKEKNLSNKSLKKVK